MLPQLAAENSLDWFCGLLTWFVPDFAFVYAFWLRDLYALA